MRLSISSPCTACGKMLDAASVPGPETPTPNEGDITICLYCHHIMAFGTGMILRDLTDPEIVELAGDPAMLNVQAFVDYYSKYWKAQRNDPASNPASPRRLDDDKQLPGLPGKIQE